MSKTVIITGGTSGYGLATATVFKNAGYTTLITGRDLSRLEKAQKESGADYIFAQDVKNYDSWVELKKYSDEMFIETTVGVGTTVTMIVYTQPRKEA